MAILNKLQALTIRKKVCLTILLIYVLIAIFAPALMPFEVTDFSHPSLATPDKTYLLGTDEMGHDIFSMLIHGFRLTVALALISGFMSTLLGTLLAFCASYLGKAVDEVLTIIANVFIIVPETVVIMFVAVFAEPTMLNTVLVIVCFSWPRVYKIIRGKLEDCMQSSKVQYTIMMRGNVIDVIRKLFPDVFPAIVSFFVLQCNKGVMYETTLSFFGVGDPLAKTWGKLINAAMNYEDLYYDNVFIWYLLPAIAVVVIFVIALALLVTEED